jgi:hypothetical protein
MKYIDATRPTGPAAISAMRRRLAGAVDRALAAPSASESWGRDKAALEAALLRVVESNRADELYAQGLDAGECDMAAIAADRRPLVELAALTMSPARAARILAACGVPLERAMRLVMAVGVDVADVLAPLDVADVIVRDDARTRGAA